MRVWKLTRGQLYSVLIAAAAFGIQASVMIVFLFKERWLTAGTSAMCAVAMILVVVGTLRGAQANP